MSDLKRLVIEIPAEDHKFLKSACAQKGISLKEFVFEAICDSLYKLKDDHQDDDNSIEIIT